MKKNLYLLLALLTATPSMAIKKLITRVITASTLLIRAKHHNKASLHLDDLDEKQILDLILNNYLREAKIKTNLPNELRRLIPRFFIHEWAIQGFNKNTGTAYDPHGFDIRGLHKKTKNRLNPRGFRPNGNYKSADPTTGKPTKYNPQGFDIDRWNKNGLHENGSAIDDNGFAQHVNHASIGLYKAIKNRNIQAVNLLLKQPNINVNSGDQYGCTPLIWCCMKGNQSLGIAKVLLEHKDINVNLGDIDDYTPLDWIIYSMLYSHKYYQYVNLWNVLVEKGAVLNQCKKYYENLNPSNFQEPRRNYIALIKQNPPRNYNN